MALVVGLGAVMVVQCWVTGIVVVHLAERAINGVRRHAPI